MKVLHIIDSLSKGGAEIILFNTIQGLRSNHPDIKNYVITLRAGGVLADQLPKGEYLGSLEFKNYNLISVLLKLRKVLKKFEIDILHSHLIDSTLISRLAVFNKVALISTYHSVIYNRDLVYFSKWRLVLDRITYNDKQHLIFVSKAVKENIVENLKIKHNFSILVNFASDEFKLLHEFNPNQSLKIIMVGNLREVKNHSLAIDALAKLSHLPIELDIYGEGRLFETLQSAIVNHNCRVTLKGQSEITSELLSKYDLFLMTSQFEGMPISLLEAMKTGLPSILNDLPMLRETAGDSAIYFKYNNEESLTESIMNIFNNKHLLKKLCDNAIVQSQKYTLDNYLKELVKVYLQTLKKLRV